MPEKAKKAGWPAAVVAMAAWVVPGSGYLLIGQRARGLTIGTTILAVFLLGTLIGGMRVVDAPDLRGGEVVSKITQKPWYVPQVLTGAVSIGAAWKANALARDRQTADIISHSRSFEIGTLYTAIAGMLNLLAIIDCASRAGQEEQS